MNRILFIFLILFASLYTTQSQSQHCVSSGQTEFQLEGSAKSFGYKLCTKIKNVIYIRYAIPALYTSETLLFSKDILGFTPLTCEAPFCTKESTSQGLLLPEGSLNGQRVKLTFSVDDENFYFTDTSSYRPLMVSELNSRSKNYGDSAHMIVGMGVKNNGRTNFPKLFSFYWKSWYDHPKLSLQKDTRHARSQKPVATWSTNDDFHVSYVNSMLIGDDSYSMNNPVYFDINRPEIWFPESVKWGILRDFEKKGIKCVDDSGKMKCRGVIHKSKFPFIKLAVGNEIVSIPPKAYIATQGDFDRNYTDPELNIIFHSPYSGNYQLTNSYTDYILLGHSFLKNYYSVFDGNNKKVIMYDSLYTYDDYFDELKEKEKAEKERIDQVNEAKYNEKLRYVTLVIIVVLICVCLYKHTPKKPNAPPQILQNPFLNNESPNAPLNSASNPFANNGNTYQSPPFYPNGGQYYQLPQDKSAL